MIGGLGKIKDQTFMFIGQQKGHNTKDRQYRNFEWLIRRLREGIGANEIS